MLGKKRFEPKLMYSINLEDLVPEDNFYRRLDALLDLRFIYKKCENIYGTTGNPSLDPVVFFKMQLFGYFENIISDRELARRLSDSLGARLYIGYDLDEAIPWHSTISRTRELIGEKIYEEVFNEVFRMCVEAELVSGKHQSIDSTLVKANASLNSLERKMPSSEVILYIEQTYNKNLSKQKTSNKDYRSKTDPDSRISKKASHKTDLYYVTHYSTDSKSRVITDVFSNHADVQDKKDLLEVTKRSKERLNRHGKEIEEVGCDKGYFTGENIRALEQQNITPYMPSQQYPNKKGKIDKDKFKYNHEQDIYVCPMGKELKRNPNSKTNFRNYFARKKDCQNCPLKEDCTPGQRRKVCRSEYEEEFERQRKRMATSKGRAAMLRRKINSEGLFAEAKGNHGMRKYMCRGLDKVRKVSYVIATVQNIKRLMSLRSMKKDVIEVVLEAQSNVCSSSLRNIVSKIENFSKITVLTYFRLEIA